MNIVTIGTGNMGSGLAGHLAPAGCGVYLAGRDLDRADGR